MRRLASASACATALLLAIVTAGAAAAADPGARATLAPPVEGASPANPAGAALDPDDASAPEATDFGSRIRLWTPVTEAEVHAADPSFREWVDLIRTGRATKQTMRLYWFYRSRLDPFDRMVPEGWRERGIAALRDGARTRSGLTAYGSRSAGAAPAGTLGTPGISPWGRWIPVGPSTIPGRATGLSRPAGQPGTLYVAKADGGVWRTTSFGQSWEALSAFEGTNSGGSVLVDPTNPSVVYFGTGEGNGAIDNYGGIGVLKTTDGGITWTASNAFSGAVRALAMHKSNPSRIYAAGDSGCYVSVDAGATFNLISGAGLPTNAGASAVLVRPDDPSWVYCAIWGGADGGIYRSTDGGTSWQLLQGGLPAKGTVARISLAISESSPLVLIAGIDQSNGTIYKTTDGGASWTALGGGSAGFCGGQCWYDNTVGIDPADPSVMYAGGVGLRRSLDGGATWASSDSGVHVDYHSILTPAPDEVVVANDGGVYRSTNRGSSWSNWGLGMDTSQYYGICAHPAEPGWAMGGTQDNGSHRRIPANNPPWQQVLGGDGGMCMTGPPETQIVLGEYQNQGIQRSTDGGASFFDARGGIGANDPRPWVGVMVADPSNRNNMWTGTNRIYRSLDARATNWVAVSSALYFSLTVTALEVAPTDSNTVYAGFDAGGLYVAANALSTPVTWQNIKQANLPTRAVRRIRAHPAVPDTVYMVSSGYGAGRIWKSVNRGGVWTDVTGDLADVPVDDLVIDADNAGTLIAATDLGMFRSDDDGAHWYGWSAGYPTVASIELTYDRAADTLRIGTHGRSMWEWREAAAAPTAVPDGATIPGAMLRVDKAGAGLMRVRWDTLSCTARDYNLFHGDLASVAAYAYDGAICGLGTSGEATVPVPASASGNVFFVIASADGAGNEGPHGYTPGGTPTPANGIGLCGIAAQSAAASCP